MTLRVAHILNSPGPGGVPRVAAALIARQAHRSIVPHIYYLKRGDQQAPDHGCDHAFADEARGKIGVVAQLADWLDAQRIDILHTHSYRPNIYGRMAGCLLRPNGLKIVAHYHNFYAEKWDENPDALHLERRLAASTDGMIAVSSAVQAHVARSLEVAPEKISVVPNGIDLQRLRPLDKASARRALGLARNGIIVGLLGRVCRQKGVDLFVEAAIELSDQSPDLSFLIAGDFEDRHLGDTLARSISAAGLNDRIKFVGHCEDVAVVYAAIDILCAPSRWEGFGLAIAEAMYLGLPVVAAQVGGVAEVIGRDGAGLMIEPDSPGAVAIALRRLANDANLRSVIGAKASERARQFCWERAAQQVEAVYRTL